MITPTHPGFAGTVRPDALHSVGGLAALYAALLDELDLTDVIVVGNSIGGWIAAEMALLHSPRVGSVILVDAAGIEVPGHPVADFFSLTLDQVLAAELPRSGQVRNRPRHPAARSPGRHARQPREPGGLRRDHLRRPQSWSKYAKSLPGSDMTLVDSGSPSIRSPSSKDRATLAAVPPNGPDTRVVVCCAEWHGKSSGQSRYRLSLGPRDMAIPRPDCVANLRQGSMSSRARSAGTSRPRARARRIWSLRPKLPLGQKVSENG